MQKCDHSILICLIIYINKFTYYPYFQSTALDVNTSEETELYKIIPTYSDSLKS